MFVFVAGVTPRRGARAPHFRRGATPAGVRPRSTIGRGPGAMGAHYRGGAMTASHVVDQPVGGAVLYVSSRVAPEAHKAFSEWCDAVHHFDTMRVDGFLSLRRFERLALVGDAAEGFPLLTLYQVEDAIAADPSGPSYT